MSIVELLGWALVIITAGCWSIFALVYSWTLYCAWSTQRDCDQFWTQLKQLIERKYGRHVKPEGPYR